VSSANGTSYSVLCDLGTYDVGESIYWDEPAQGIGNDAKIWPGAYCKPNYGAFFLQRSADHVSGTSIFSDGTVNGVMILSRGGARGGSIRHRPRIRRPLIGAECGSAARSDLEGSARAVRKGRPYRDRTEHPPSK
jgi:hypothetical protein